MHFVPRENALLFSPTTTEGEAISKSLRCGVGSQNDVNQGRDHL